MPSLVCKIQIKYNKGIPLVSFTYQPDWTQATVIRGSSTGGLFQTDCPVVITVGAFYFLYFLSCPHPQTGFLSVIALAVLKHPL